jgi:hypothetical protein
MIRWGYDGSQVTDNLLQSGSEANSLTLTILANKYRDDRKWFSLEHHIVINFTSTGIR